MTPTFSRRAAALIATCIFALALSAHGQPSAADKAAAEALFEQGKTLLSQNDTAAACAKFDASRRLDPAVGTLLFLGECYEKLGKKASAWVTFKEASTLAERLGDQRKNIADVRASALQPQVSYLTVNVATPTEGMTVRRGSVELSSASWGSPLPVDAGKQEIEATAPGKQRWSMTVDVRDGGETYSVDVPALAAAGGPPPVPPPGGPVPPQPDKVEESSPPPTLIIAGSVIGGLGIVGLVIGGVFGALAKDSNDASLEHCPRQPNLCDPEGVSLREEAQTRATVSTAMTSGGSEQARAPAWQLASRLGPGQAELLLRGQF
jgi:serine/threonine-protein kinase